MALCIVKCSQARPPASAPSLTLGDAEPGSPGWVEGGSLPVVALGRIALSLDVWVWEPASGAVFPMPVGRRFWPVAAGQLVTMRVGG